MRFGLGLGLSSPQLRTVSTVNHAPTGIVLSAYSFSEYIGDGELVATLTAQDSDYGDSWTFELVAGGGDTDNSNFAIVGSTLVTAHGSFNYDVQSAFTIRLRVTDSQSEAYETTVNLTCTPENFPPTDIQLSATAFSEYIEVGEIIGNFTVTDADVGDSWTYSTISGEGATDNSKFDIVDNHLVAGAGAFDYDVQSTFSIRIRATDSYNNTYEEVFALTCYPDNDPPTISFDDFSVEPNSITTLSGQLSFYDRESDDVYIRLESVTSEIKILSTSGVTMAVGVFDSYTTELEFHGSYGSMQTAINENIVVRASGIEGTETLTAKIRDAGIAPSYVTDTAILTIAAVTDNPEWSTAGPFSLNREQTIGLPGITITDSDEGETYSVTLDVVDNAGQLNITSGTGVIFVTGAADTWGYGFEFSGLKSQIQAALDSLQFKDTVGEIASVEIQATIADPITGPEYNSYYVNVVNADPEWSGVPATPIAVSPAGFVQVDGIAITDADTMGGTYEAVFAPNHGQIKFSGDNTGLSYGSYTWDSWTSSTVTLTGSRSAVSSQALANFYFRPDGYEGDAVIAISISEDGSVPDTANIPFSCTGEVLAAVSDPVNEPVIEGHIANIDAYSFFTGGSGDSANWTIEIVGGADSSFFSYVGGGVISFGPQDYELPGDSGLDNTYHVEVKCTDSVTLEEVVTTLIVEVVDSANEIVTVEFDPAQTPTKGTFSLNTAIGTIICNAPIEESELQATINASIGSGNIAVSDVSAGGFTLTFADSLGDVGTTAVSAASTYYRSSAELGWAPMWNASDQYLINDTGWTSTEQAQTINNSFTETTNTDVYSNPQRSSVLFWQYPVPTYSRIEVVGVTASVTGFTPTYSGTVPTIYQYGWNYNNGGFSLVDAIGINVPDSYAAIPLFTSASDPGIVGTNLSTLEAHFLSGNALQFGIVVRMGEEGDIVRIDGADVSWSYFELSVCDNPTVTVVQEGGT